MQPVYLLFPAVSGERLPPVEAVLCLCTVNLLYSFLAHAGKSIFLREERCYMTEEEKAAWAKERLSAKYAELGRLPKKEDFDEATRSRIKAFLGPWPRALERAGLKKPRDMKRNTNIK